MIPHVYSTRQEKEDADVDFYLQKEHSIKWRDQILLNRSSKVFLALLLTAIVAPLLIYRFYYFPSSDSPPSDGFSTGSCLSPRVARLPCGVGYMRLNECHVHCCFDPESNFCYHRFPSRFTYITDREWTENATLLPRISTVPFASQSSTRNVKLSISEESPTYLILTLYDSTSKMITSKRNEHKTYTYEVASPELNVIVKSLNRTILNTARGPIIASDNIWEMAFYLTNETMYGLGEIPLKPGTVKILYNHRGGLSSIPLIFAKVNSSYHGVLIDANSPTEVSILGNNHIIVRSITSFGLKLHIFVGPRPKDIMKDAMSVIGSTMKVDYWMMGAHICNEIAKSVPEALESLRNFITNATREAVPYESHCGAAPIVFNANKCEVNETEVIMNGINLLREAGKRFVPHVSPYVRLPDVRFEGNYTITDNDNRTSADGIEEDSETNKDCYKILSNYSNIFYRKPDTLEIYNGTVGESKVLYPKYEDAPVQFLNELWEYNTTLDGVILENNWPLDQTENKSLNYTALYLPYFNQFFETAFEETPQWNLTLTNDTRYLQEHNNYGDHFASAFQKLFDKDVPTWSTSLKMNGKIAINRQSVNTSWTNLHREIINTALGGISGHWLWTSPICGDMDNFDIDTQANLCVKWYLASTYFPMIKIHSKNQDRDPLAFVGTHRRVIIQAMNRRLSLLPYLYTTLQDGPTLRPMFYQFPNSEQLADINTQFSVGEDLIIVPNLQPLQSHVHFWMPPGTWYELLGGLRIEGEEGQPVTMSTTEEDFLSLIRGGSILVMQKETRATAEETRLGSRLSLMIALECTENKTLCQATGQLFVTKNISLTFTATDNTLIISPVGEDVSPLCDPNNYIMSNNVHEIYVFGLKDELNNYDHQRYIQTSISLCNLGSINEFSLT